MSKLIQAKIDVTKINKDLIFIGQKGKYVDVNIWINDKEDQFGNICSIEQRTEKGAEKIYLGNGKEYKPKTEIPDDNPAPKSAPAPAKNEDPNDLPF